MEKLFPIVNAFIHNNTFGKMSMSFRKVKAYYLHKSGEIFPKYDFPVTVFLEFDIKGLNIKLREETKTYHDLCDFTIYRNTPCAKMTANMYVISIETDSIFLKFSDDADFCSFHSAIKRAKCGKDISAFEERTEDSSAMQYFQFYGYLSQQQNMMQDYVRTATYQKAILSNVKDFENKVVLDVGAGSGILSFFAAQAGARKVYAVEASAMAEHAETLVKANNLSDKIIVISGKIEEVDLPEPVDIIISEPMGYMLYNERMLETYLHAKKWLQGNGRMFPTRGELHVAPFTDDSLYMEQYNKANFWCQQSFHGVDLTSLRRAALKEYFRQPVVDTFDIRICMSKSIRHCVDFQEARETDLHRIEIPLDFHILETGTVHGLAFWFDVAFIGSTQTVWLSTCPTEPLTHWYQVRCLLETPVFAKAGQLLRGSVLLVANERQSYDVTIEVCIEGTNTISTNTLDLKNPYFRHTGQVTPPPPGANNSSPSEAYWGQLDAQGVREAINMVNGISVDGLGDVAMDISRNSNLIELSPGNEPNIHPGSISSTGRQRILGTGNNIMTANPAAHLIGAGISPSLLSTTTHQIVLGHPSHFPVNSSLMIGDYLTPGNALLTELQNLR